jgi:hypothetical protein
MEKGELKIFHIAGITELYKHDLIEKLKKLQMFTTCDLDEETEKIYKNKEIQSKLKELDTVKLARKKKLENEINETWKDKLDEYIKKNIKENENSYGLIFIGNTVNIKHMKTKVVIPQANPMHKFFLKVNFKQNAQEIIKYNLKKYHDDIVEGEFPLDYINLEYLINSRELLQKGYQKLHYNVIPLDKIIYHFEHGINMKKPDVLYVVLKEEHLKDIVSKKKIYAFTEDWIALSSLITGIDRGYTDGVAFIKEKTKGSFKKLHTSCYIYVVPSTSFLSMDNSNSKFQSDKKIKIIKSMAIDDVFEKLKEMKIKIN